MNSEITKMYDECEVRGWVFYDAACPWCRGLARRLAPVLRPQHVEFAPLQASWARARFGGTEEEWRSEMRFQLADGRCYGGADAVLEIASFIAWARPWLLLTRLPGVRPLLRAAYARVAALRPCANGSCRVGWCFMALGTAVPAGLLFHRPFVERVILPFLKALGAF